MSDLSRIKPSHTGRAACIYVRQSSPSQVEHNRESTARQYALALQGIGVCGHCGRRLSTHYRGRNSTPGYHCAGKDIVEGRGVYCLNVGGVAIDEAVATAFLNVVTPASVEAMRIAVEQARDHHDAALAQWRLEVERLRYEAEKSERRYRAVEPLCNVRKNVA